MIAINDYDFVRMRHLTVRNLPKAVAEALEREKRVRGTSLNKTVIDLLSQSLGVTERRSNGLGAMAGGWTDQEHEAFEKAVACFEEVDPELWR